MQYPLISEYVAAIRDAGDNLDQLKNLVPVPDDHGEPYRSSGAFAVVFKMKDEQTGKCYALKCFTEEQQDRAEAYRQIADELEMIDSPYVTSVKYLEKEFFVDSICEDDEFPVLMMDWIDGETMEAYIAKNYQDSYAMSMLCYRFCKLAMWLRSQPFAHGDIKPDNIMVRPDGSLTLVDYDGMFVPSMKGQQSPTIGTKDFSHPDRTINDFDETIDDFALSNIALSLKAISLKPSLLEDYGASDRLLFSATDYHDLSKSKVVTALQELMTDNELNTLYSLFLLAMAQQNLAMSSFRLFAVKKPVLSVDDIVKLGIRYCQGDGRAIDYGKAFALFLQAAELGDSFAQLLLGCMYEQGEGVSQNIEVAIEWYRKSAEQKNAEAMLRLAICYEKKMCPLQYKQAQKLCENPNYTPWGDIYCDHWENDGLLGAESVDVHQRIAEWYEYSDVSDKSKEIADLYGELVYLGNSEAMWRLGICYEYGIGVKQSYSQALYLYGTSKKYRYLSQTILTKEEFSYYDKWYGYHGYGDRDEYGVTYSKYENRLLSADTFIKGDCIIKAGTEVICDRAFATRWSGTDYDNAMGGTSTQWWEEECLFSSIKIADTVTCIGEMAFEGCKELLSIVIPNSVRYIGDLAFKYCIYNHRTTKTNQKYPSVNL